MKHITMEKVFLPAVQQFVKEQGGRFAQHCSHTLLVLLIMERLNASAPWPYVPGERKTYADLIAEGDNNAAYEATLSLFERMLECGCGVNTNGHHRAQDFTKAMHVVYTSMQEAKEAEQEEQVRAQAIAGGSKLYQSLSRRANMAVPEAHLKNGAAVEVSVSGTVVSQATDPTVYFVEVIDNAGHTDMLAIQQDKIKTI